MSFTKAIRYKKPLKMVIDGPSGSGKTYTALRLAFQLGKKIFVIDTEHGRASLYAGEVVDGIEWDFQTNELTCFSVHTYIDAIQEAVQAGADVIIIDSISHAWDSENGILTAVQKKGNEHDKSGREIGSFRAWMLTGNTLYKQFVEAILAAPCHTICTMRTKTDYDVSKGDDNRIKISKKGTTPIQRDGLEYEFDIIMRMENGFGNITKSPSPTISSEVSIEHPGKELAEIILNWLNQGVSQTPKPEPASNPNVPEETPGIGPEYSPDEAFDQVQKLLDEHRITTDVLKLWGKNAGLPENLGQWKSVMDDELKIRMASELTGYAMTGKFEDIPF